MRGQELTPLPLTHKQAKCLAFLQVYTGENGIAPSYDELMEHLELVSKSGVHRLIAALEQRGRIARTPGRARCIRVVAPLRSADVPRKGQVADIAAAFRRAADRLEAKSGAA